MSFGEGLSVWQSFLFYLAFLWSIIWKGIALWNASKNSQRNWFVAMLVLNTFGVLEIIYLFRFAKKRMRLIDIKEGLGKIFYSKPKN
jgi:uncharacterized membrane protein YiaA